MALRFLICLLMIGSIALANQPDEECQILKYEIKEGLGPKQKATAKALAEGIYQKFNQTIKAGKKQGFGFRRALLLIALKGDSQKGNLILNIYLYVIYPNKFTKISFESQWVKCPAADSLLVKEVINQITKLLISEIIILEPLLPISSRRQVKNLVPLLFFDKLLE